MTQPARVLITALVVALSVTGVAQAAWMASGTGSAHTEAVRMPEGTPPTAGATGSTVTLEWARALLRDQPLTDYTVRRYDSSLQPVGQLAVTCAADSCAVDELSVPTGTWYYTVMPLFEQWAGGESDYSAAVTVEPGTPGDFTATAGSPDQVDLAWTAADGAEQVNIYRRRDDVAEWGAAIQTLPAEVGTYADDGLDCATTYHYRLEPFSGETYGTAAEATATTEACAPAAPLAPTDLSATGVSATQIDLSWAHDGADGTTYRIERSDDGSSGWTEVGGVEHPDVAFSDTTLGCGQTLHYRVLAAGAEMATSPPSDAASATTQTCTIRVSALTGASVRQGNTWTANATTTVRNQNGEVMSGVAVSATWTIGGATETVWCSTNGEGQCTLSRAGLPNSTGEATFMVTALTLPGFTYSPREGDPTSVTIPR